MFGHLIQGLSTALLLGNLFYLVLGVTGGIVIGALPGLTATMGVAILLPFTFGMDAVTGLIMLVGIYIGAIYGGSISAILLNTPGTPASAATCFDGYALVKKGYPTKALSASTYCFCIRRAHQLSCSCYYITCTGKICFEILCS